LLFGQNVRIKFDNNSVIFRASGTEGIQKSRDEIPLRGKVMGYLPRQTAAIGISLLLCHPASSASLTQEYANKVIEADLSLQMLNDGFTPDNIEKIKSVAVLLAVKELCGPGYVEYSSPEKIGRFVGQLSQRIDVPESLIIEKASKFGSLVVLEKKSTKDTLSFCRMIRQTDRQR